MNDPAPSLEERVARQETAEDARALIAAYARAIDHQDTGALAEIFDADMVLTVPGRSWTGLDDVIGFFASYWAEQPHPRRHFITNVAITSLSADQAETGSYFFFVSANGDTPTMGWGDYRDTFARRGGRLLFRSKHIDLEVEADVRAGWVDQLRAVAL